MLTRPSHIPPAIEKAPLAFPWNNGIAVELDEFDGVPPRLAGTLKKISYKGRAALGLACLEWVIWRFSGWEDIDEPLRRLESAWASQVSLDYAQSLDSAETNTDLTMAGDPKGALQTALLRLRRLLMIYRKGKNQIGSIAGRCALLAIHVLPPDCGFEAWLEKAAAALVLTDSAGPADPDATSIDFSDEAPVPRAWFETLAVPRDAAQANTELNAFLASLDAAANPHLVPADEMRANGFHGTPYTYP